jgi:hypothetical protein
MGDGAVNEVVEKVVRADVSRLLHNEYPRQAIYIDCLAAAIPAGIGSAPTPVPLARQERGHADSSEQTF